MSQNSTVTLSALVAPTPGVIVRVAVLPVGRHALWRVSGDVKVALEPMAGELVGA